MAKSKKTLTPRSVNTTSPVVGLSSNVILCPECGAPLELRGGRGFVIRSVTMVLEDP